MFAMLAAWLGMVQAQEALIEKGDVWLLQPDGPIDPTWTDVGFDDSGWSSGPTQIGFGEDDQERVVVPQPGDPYTTLYLRHPFTATPGASSTLVLELLVDDGAAVYLNGTEIYRTNLPAGALTPDTLASADVDLHEEHRFQTVRIPLLADLPSDNLLAVEVHQSSPDSDDLSFDLSLTGTDGSTRITRGPYLQMGGPDSVLVRWRTDDEVPGEVSIGTSPDALDQSFSGPAAFDHEVAITGLDPATDYFYDVGDGAQVLAGDATHTFRTAPTPGTDTPTRIWVIGDAGTADAGAEMVKEAYLGFTGERHTDLWLQLGDNAYGDGTDAQYQGAVFDMYPELLRSSVTWPTLGNHDGHTAQSDGMIGPYYDIFTMPMAGELGGVASGTEAYYSFDWANIHFVVLDSYSSALAEGSPQWIWLEEDLLSTDQDWIIAYWHHPPYTKGTHDSDTDVNHVLMRQVALPILEDHGVDLVLSGHSHGYERSYLIDGHYGFSFEFDPETMLVDGGDGNPGGDGAYAKPEGLASHAGAVYVVAGSSGNLGFGSFDHPVHHVAMGTLGSLVLDVDGDRLDGTFVSSIGETLDQFTIEKGGGNSDTGTATGKKRDDKGCGCATSGRGATLPALLLVGLLGLRRRKTALAALLALSTSASAHPTAETRLVPVDAHLADAPCDPAEWVKRARIFMDDGRHTEALDDLDRAVLCAPTDPRIAAARGEALNAVERYAEAERDLLYAVSLAPRAEGFAQLARAEAAVGRCNEAAADWARYEGRVARPTPDAFVFWSRSLQCADRTREALAVVDRGLATLGPVAALQREGIELLVELGLPQAAVHRAEVIAQGHPAPLTWRVAAVRIWTDAGEPDRADAARQRLRATLDALPDRVRQRRAVALLTTGI